MSIFLFFFRIARKKQFVFANHYFQVFQIWQAMPDIEAHLVQQAVAINLRNLVMFDYDDKTITPHLWEKRRLSVLYMINISYAE